VSWLLDSDVLSQPAKKAGNARVISWLKKHQDQCYTSSIVIAQLEFWVRTKRGKQRVALQKWLTDLIEAMHGRFLGSTCRPLKYGRNCSTSSKRPVNPCRLKIATSQRLRGGITSRLPKKISAHGRDQQGLQSGLSRSNIAFVLAIIYLTKVS
jgi:hypothetical protein